MSYTNNSFVVFRHQFKQFFIIISFLTFPITGIAQEALELATPSPLPVPTDVIETAFPTFTPTTSPMITLAIPTPTPTPTNIATNLPNIEATSTSTTISAIEATHTSTMTQTPADLPTATDTQLPVIMGENQQVDISMDIPHPTSNPVPESTSEIELTLTASPLIEITEEVTELILTTEQTDNAIQSDEFIASEMTSEPMSGTGTSIVSIVEITEEAEFTPQVELSEEDVLSVNVEATEEITYEITIEPILEVEMTEEVEPTLEVEMTEEPLVETTQEATWDAEATEEPLVETTQEAILSIDAVSATEEHEIVSINLTTISGTTGYSHGFIDRSHIEIQLLTGSLQLIDHVHANVDGTFTLNVPTDEFFWLIIYSPKHLQFELGIWRGESIPDVFLLGGDLNNDGCINSLDVAVVTANFDLPNTPDSDINYDGITDMSDLAILAGNYIQDCTPNPPIEAIESIVATFTDTETPSPILDSGMTSISSSESSITATSTANVATLEPTIFLKTATPDT